MPLLVCHPPRLVQPHIYLIYGANCGQPHTETLLKQANLSNYCWPSSDAAFIEIRPVSLGNCCPGTTLQAPVSELPPHSSYLTIVVALYFLVTQLRSSTAHVPVKFLMNGNDGSATWQVKYGIRGSKQRALSHSDSWTSDNWTRRSNRWHVDFLKNLVYLILLH